MFSPQEKNIVTTVAKNIMSSLAAFNRLDEQVVVIVDEAIKPYGLDAFEIAKINGIWGSPIIYTIKPKKEG